MIVDGERVLRILGIQETPEDGRQKDYSTRLAYEIVDAIGDSELTLTPSQIIEEICKSGCVEEIFLELSRCLISDRKDMQKELSEKDSTLKLIGKISKDKAVLDILSG